MMAEQIGPIHPGEHLKEFLDDFGLSQYRLAVDVRVPPRRVNEIIQGKRGISADTALRLARYFGTTPDYWMSLQNKYELEMAEGVAGDAIRREIPPLVSVS